MNFDEGSGTIGETLSGLVMAFTLIFGLPTFAAMIGATVYGIARAVQFRHPAMVILSVISMVCGGGVIALLTVLSDRESPYAFGAFGGVYIAGNVLIPAWWFAVGRRRFAQGGL